MTGFKSFARRTEVVFDNTTFETANGTIKLTNQYIQNGNGIKPLKNIN